MCYTGVNMRKLQTHCRRGHEFTPENIILVNRMRTCRECRIASNKVWFEKNKEQYKKKEKFVRLKSKYGITPERFMQMMEEQHGLCAICDKDMEPPCIDHDHRCCPGDKSCGKCVRGLICDNCNKGLGQFKDDLYVVDRAAEYLREHAYPIRSQ